MNSDPSSLQNLNDIVVPPPAPWWPLAPGWYIAGGILALLLLWRAYVYWQASRRNRYRRAALKELSVIRTQGDAAAMRRLPLLLKRTALSAWPREEVASLSGPAWHDFLDRTARTKLFTGGAGQILDQLAYTTNDAAPPAAADAGALLTASEFWLTNHHREAGKR
jgi:hypothetical protein